MKKANITLITILFIFVGTIYADEKTDKDEKSNKISYSLQEEQDVDDIPFNTAQIAAKYRLIRDLNVLPSENMINLIDLFDIDIEEESEVDDIPFNTAEIVNRLNISKQIDENDYSLEDEKEIDDIPFNTEDILKSLP